METGWESKLRLVAGSLYSCGSERRDNIKYITRRAIIGSQRVLVHVISGEQNPDNEEWSAHSRGDFHAGSEGTDGQPKGDHVYA